MIETHTIHRLQLCKHVVINWFCFGWVKPVSADRVKALAEGLAQAQNLFITYDGLVSVKTATTN